MASVRCWQSHATTFKAFQQSQNTLSPALGLKKPLQSNQYPWIKVECNAVDTVQLNCFKCGLQIKDGEGASHLCSMTVNSVIVSKSPDSELVECVENVNVGWSPQSESDPLGGCDIPAQSQKRNSRNSGLNRCEFCKKVFSRKWYLEKHLKVHLKNQDHMPTQSRFCATEIPNFEVEDDDTHINIPHKKMLKTYHCDICNKNFTLKDSFFRHMRIHSGERPFTCHICGKSFRDSGGLARHLKDVHIGIKNFPCDLCGRSFASRATCEDHRRTHTGERPFVCDSCGKTFKSKASLYLHSKIHTDSFPHPCTHCDKCFRRRQEFLAHVSTHTGEKPHSCNECGRSFRVKGELLRHKLIHSESKPHVCVLCGLSFRQKRYLRNHEKSRHRSHGVVLPPRAASSLSNH